MRCDRVRSELAAYRDLDPAQLAEVRAHVAGCPECADAWRAYRAQDKVLSSLPQLQPSPQTIAGVRRRTVEAQQRPARRWNASGRTGRRWNASGRTGQRGTSCRTSWKGG